MAAITQPQYRVDGGRGGARAAVGRRDRQRLRGAGARGPPARASSRSTTCSATPRRGRAAPSSRCCRSGSCSRRAPPTSPRPSCTPTPTRCGPAGSGRATSTSGADDRYLDLPAVLPRERAELVVLLRPGRRRHRGPDPEVVDQPVLGGGGPSPDHPHLAHALRHGDAGPARPAAAPNSGSACSALIMPDLDAHVRDRRVRRLRHDRDGDPTPSPGSRVSSCPTRSMGHVAPGYEIAVVDKETGELCAEGETGELWLRGTRGIQLFLEYFDNPEANAASFEDGWFKTGRHGPDGPRRQRLLPGAGQGPHQGRGRERLGPRGGGGRGHGARGGPGGGGGQEARVAGPGGRGLRDHGARGPRTRRARSAR